MGDPASRLSRTAHPHQQSVSNVLCESNRSRTPVQVRFRLSRVDSSNAGADVGPWATDEEIVRARAYELYEARGRTDGHAEED